MKILVLSDSHSYSDFMQRCMEACRPDAVIHLGDYVSDGKELSLLYPGVPFYQVPGNCDSYRCDPGMMHTIIVNLSGVRLMLTHGHHYYVKESTYRLLREARRAKVDAVLYGHTHCVDCHQEEDGLWVLNPGSAGYFGGSAGWMEIENGKILRCRTLRKEDLEAMK